MSDLIVDLRAAWRTMRSHLSSTVFVLASLATVFGSLAAGFTIADRALIRTLPASHPEELVIPRWQAGAEFPADALMGNVDLADGGHSSSTSFSVPAWQAFRDRVPQIRHLAAFSSVERINAAWGGRAFVATGHSVSGNFFGIFDIRPQAGRFPGDADDRADAAPVVVLSDHFWRTTLGARTDAVSSTIRLNGVPFTIIGIAPPGFNGAIELEDAPDLFVTLSGHALLGTSPRCRPTTAFGGFR